MRTESSIATARSSPAVPEAPSAPGSGARQGLLLAAVLLVTFIAYSGTLKFEFAYDDGAQIVYNPVVQSWKWVPRMFAEHVWSSQQNTPPNYYRPVFLLWCLLNFKAFGMHPGWWHLTTVLLHLAATLLAYRVAARLVRDPFVAIVTALIFGLHPIHLESVAWISGVTDPLMATFVLGALLAYLRFREEGRGLWLGASLALYGLACLSKEVGIMLPALVAGYEWILRGRGARSGERLRRAGLALLPYAIIAAGYLAARHRALQGFSNPVVNLPWAAIPMTWPELLWFYARKLVWPVGLSPFYDTPYVTRPDLEHFWLPLAALAAIAAGAWVLLRRTNAEPAAGERYSPRQVALFAIVIIVAPLLPCLDILSLEPREIAHDRYLYLPCAGFAVLAAMALRRVRAGQAQLFGQPAARSLAVLALAAALAIGTVQQGVYWANDLLLFYRAVRMAPSSISASNNLANALLERNYYDEGIRIHQQILKRDPGYWLSHYNLGNAYYKLGKLDLAQQHMFRAAQLNPINPQVFLYLGMLQMKMNALPEAEQNVRQAIRMWPSALGARYVLGTVLAQQGRWRDAAEAYRQELALDPDQPKVREELAKAERQAK